MCKTRPEDKSMHGLVEQVLLSAIQALKSASTEDDLNIRASLKIFEVLQKADLFVKGTCVYPLL